jgi:hypothetical protein
LTPDGYFLENFAKVVESPVEGGLYGYALNNPITYVDPTGNCGDCFVGMAGIAAGVESIQKWNQNTSLSDKAIDVAGVTVDTVGLFLPVATVGAGIWIKGARKGSDLNQVNKVSKSSDSIKIKSRG